MTLNTDLKPMPFCPVISGKTRQHCTFRISFGDICTFSDLQGTTNTLTNVSIFVFALSAAAHIANSLDVPFLEASLVVENGDAVGLHHKGQSRRGTICWVIVVVSILKKGKLFSYKIN